MNITQGPMLERFAGIIDVKPSEVVEWVNQYVNHPELATTSEPTEKERFESIKAYIQGRIASSSDARIRHSLAADPLRRAAA